MSQLQVATEAGPAMVESDSEFFAKTGPVPTAFDEARRFPRFYYRARVQATIYPLAGGLAQAPQQSWMLTRDLSRGGINLVHSEQLFPGQKIDIVLHDGTPRSVEVVWCRRLANRCYTAGCRFVKAAEPLGEPIAEGLTPSSATSLADDHGDVSSPTAM